VEQNAETSIIVVDTNLKDIAIQVNPAEFSVILVLDED